MNPLRPLPNIPRHQHFVQHTVDEFNRNELEWRRRKTLIETISAGMPFSAAPATLNALTLESSVSPLIRIDRRRRGMRY